MNNDTGDFETVRDSEVELQHDTAPQEWFPAGDTEPGGLEFDDAPTLVNIPCSSRIPQEAETLDEIPSLRTIPNAEKHSYPEACLGCGSHTCDGCPGEGRL